MFPWSQTNKDKWPNELSLAEAPGGAWHVSCDLVRGGLEGEGRGKDEKR